MLGRKRERPAPYAEEYFRESFGRYLWALIEEEKKIRKKSRVLFLCIGSDRCTGDCLGPLVGHMLKNGRGYEWDVLGTLHEPVHALNLPLAMKRIRREYAESIVVAVDASLGRADQVGMIVAGRGALRPGQGLDKKLGSVGDLFVTGVVGTGGVRAGEEKLFYRKEFFEARLSFVMDMAEAICRGIRSAQIQDGFYLKGDGYGAKSRFAEKFPSDRRERGSD